MERRRNATLVLVLACIAVALNMPGAFATTSFGSASGETSAEAAPGGSARFVIYLVNTGSAGLNVIVKTEAPALWVAAASPSSMEVLPSHAAGEGYVPMASGGSYVKSKPVYITVAVPSNAAGGDYVVTARATAWASQADIGATHERSFRFNIRVRKQPGQGSPGSLEATGEGSGSTSPQITADSLPGEPYGEPSEPGNYNLSGQEPGQGNSTSPQEQAIENQTAPSLTGMFLADVGGLLASKWYIIAPLVVVLAIFLLIIRRR